MPLKQTLHSNRYRYFFRERPEVLAELEKLGVRFVEVELGTGDEPWPGLQLPSGALLCIAQDPEGNGPGAIHVFDPA